jgi:hypothetical protein
MLLSWCEAWGASFLIIAFVAAANPFYPLFADVGVDPRFLRKGVGDHGIFASSMSEPCPLRRVLRLEIPACIRIAGRIRFHVEKPVTAPEPAFGGRLLVQVRSVDRVFKSLPNLGRKFQYRRYTIRHLPARNSSVYSRAYPIWVGGSSIGDTR